MPTYIVPVPMPAKIGLVSMFTNIVLVFIAYFYCVCIYANAFNNVVI